VRPGWRSTGFDDKGKVLQQTDYYPFGLEIDRNDPAQTTAVRNGVNRYNFLGKETQVSTGYIDLQARFYDPAVGRFMAEDPETEGQLEFSPYHYSFDNPIRFSDPDGRWPGEGLFKAIKIGLTDQFLRVLRMQEEVQCWLQQV
jgi:RHS repeat-associated protein